MRPLLMELTELVPRVEPAMLDNLCFLRLGPYPFVFTGNNIWTVEELITSLRRRLTHMAAVEAAAIGRSLFLLGGTIRLTGTVHLTCAGWGEEDAGWDSDELPELSRPSHTSHPPGGEGDTGQKEWKETIFQRNIKAPNSLIYSQTNHIGTGRDGYPLMAPVPPIKTGTVGSPKHTRHTGRWYHIAVSLQPPCLSEIEAMSCDFHLTPAEML
ncbi:hypothetical protein B0H10DRAFT_2195284 [Mycena sp. CBHHK59/15]|nr:hypothetical protein B0H10DRAFT_2195284 [Mycena sp. CBHHK59/15]